MHAAFARVKRGLPAPLANFLRGMVTAFIVPNQIARRSGHWRSAFAGRAVDREGNALPWLTYPCIEFLRRQDFDGKEILEFGGGQSTLWWAARARSVRTIETDRGWADELAARAPANARITHMDIADRTRAEFVADIAATLREEHPAPFDIIVIDSWESRSSYAGIARDMLAEDGAIICDNSDGYRIFEAFRDSGLSRLDFHGIAPGTSIPTVTSIYFRGRCFLFDNTQPIGREPR